MRKEGGNKGRQERGRKGWREGGREREKKAGRKEGDCLWLYLKASSKSRPDPTNPRFREGSQSPPSPYTHSIDREPKSFTQGHLLQAGQSNIGGIKQQRPSTGAFHRRQLNRSTTKRHNRWTPAHRGILKRER